MTAPVQPSTQPSMVGQPVRRVSPGQPERLEPQRQYPAWFISRQPDKPGVLPLVLAE